VNEIPAATIDPTMNEPSAQASSSRKGGIAVGRPRGISRADVT
jgi:hypothetical protein